MSMVRFRGDDFSGMADQYVFRQSGAFTFRRSQFEGQLIKSVLDMICCPD